MRPVVSRLRRRHPDWDLRVCLVPCPYATGAEADVIRAWPEALEVWTPSQTTLHWGRGTGRGGKGLVVFLGGDPWHALLLKHRWQQPALAYFPQPSGWEATKWLGGFDEVCRGYLQPESGGVGDLRVDAVRDRLVDPESSQGVTLGLFPGSRWIHLKASLGPYLRMVDLLPPGLTVELAASPFVSRERLAEAAANPWRLGIDCSTARLHGDHLITEAGRRVRVIWGHPYEVISRCDLAVSLPGTNTAELAIAGKPTVVPLNERVPVGGGGLLGLLDRLPGLGRLKNWLKHRKRRRLRYLALPNQLAGRAVMPEFMVRDDLLDLSDFVNQLLHDRSRLEVIGREAREVMGPPGAADRLVDAIERRV